ncbi:MAG: AraC-like DNA-binding protein [Hyphomicrobiaceae bacterium]|jgi:AraC-like DNA-binding protein
MSSSEAKSKAKSEARSATRSASAPKIRIGGTATLPAYIDARGGSGLRVLHAVGIVEAELSQPEGWLALDRMAWLYEAAAEELNDPQFGLSFGAIVPLQSFGLLSYVVLNAADVETALKNLARYSGNLSVTGINAELTVADDVARIAFTVGLPDPDRHRQFFESTALVLCVMMKALAGDDWKPREIWFEHAPVDSFDSIEGVEARLQATVRYQAERNSIFFDAAYLARAVPNADRSLLPVIEKYVGDVIGRGESDPLVTRLRDELARTLCDGSPDIGHVARRLATSPRTLQRQLQLRGLGFKSLLGEVRTELAKQYLAQPGLAVTEIAFLLGYGDLSAFDRAFRRHVGLSPRGWRRVQQHGQD